MAKKKIPLYFEERDKDESAILGNTIITDVPKRVLMAMSGGVDSSASAIVLLQEGFEVVGATMHLLNARGDGEGASARKSDAGGIDDVASMRKRDDALLTCMPFSPEIADAKACAEKLGIEHHVFDFTDVFADQVIDRFCCGYLAGKTPNPCIDCNRFIKFGVLSSKRDELGFDYLATGHYARRDFEKQLGRYVLKKGVDENKDQSYVLAFLTQDELSRVLLPLGDMTKTEVRKIASKAGLGNAEKGESQDICFVQNGKYSEFIEARSESPSLPGPIFDESGKSLGEHNGLLNYTIGQRKGLGIAAPNPLYVVSKDASDNALIVGPKESLMTNEVKAHNANLVTYEIGEVANKVINGHAKTHYRHKGEVCEAVFNSDGSLEVAFKEPIVKAASGQTLVVYDKDTVVGAGIID